MVFDTASSTPIATYDYDAFGTVRTDTPTPVTSYLYTGQQFDAESGLYYLRSRYYDPADGRLLSRDSYPVDYGNPTQLNRYVYGANNPVNGFDPSGQLFIERVATDNMTEKERRAHARYHAGTHFSRGMDRNALLLESIFSAATDQLIIATVWSAMKFHQQLTNPAFKEKNLHKGTMAIGTVYHLKGAVGSGYEPGSITKLTVRLFFRVLNGIFIPLEPEKSTKFEAISPLWCTRFRNV